MLKQLKPFKTSSQMPPVLMQALSSAGLCKRDFAAWWPVNLDEPAIGSVIGCPNLRGFLVATNGIDALVLRENHESAFFCHFRNFQCDDDTLQSRVNQCLMPFSMWRLANMSHMTPEQKENRAMERAMFKASRKQLQSSPTRGNRTRVKAEAIFF